MMDEHWDSVPAKLLTWGSETWPELHDPQLLVAANPIDGGLAIMALPTGLPISQGFLVQHYFGNQLPGDHALALCGQDSMAMHTTSALRGYLGFQNPQVDTILVGNTLLPELQDGDHLHLRGALRPQLCQHWNVRTPI